MKTHRSNGFTLIELLVVIAIVGVVVTLASLSMSRVFASMKTSQSANNLRQIGVAVQLYVGETGQYPAGTINWRTEGYSREIHVQGTWLDLLSHHLGPQTSYQRSRDTGERYYNPVYHCPASKIETPVPYATYGCNPRVMQDTAYSSGEIISVMRVKRPSEVIIVTDSTQNAAGRGGPHLWGVNASSNESRADDFLPVGPDEDGSSQQHIRYRHNGSANCLFADGHVEAKKKGTLKNRNWVIDY